MSGKTDKEIKEERSRIVSKLSEIVTEPFQVIDSFFLNQLLMMQNHYGL